MKKHKTDDGVVVAACDRDILGKTFEENNLVLNIDEKFFGGEVCELEEIETELKTACTSHIAGNNIISRLIERKVLDKNSILEISGVKHVMVFRIP